jgi:hypothetical protein
VSDGVINIRGKQYQTVAKRVADFRKAYPSWTIDTHLVELDEVSVVVQCKIRDESGRLISSGLAEEVRKASKINQTSAVENCETSAVGRALAFLGLGGDYGIASADEVLRAVSQQGAASEAPDDDSGVIKAIEALVAETSCSSPGAALAALAKTKGALAWRDLSTPELGKLYSALAAYDVEERTAFLDTWAQR